MSALKIATGGGVEKTSRRRFAQLLNSKRSSDHSSAVLLSANYSNNTGYAWANILRLFKSISVALRSTGRLVLVSFDRLEEPISPDLLAHFDCVIELSSSPRTLASWRDWYNLCSAVPVEAIYLTDKRFWASQYGLFRLLGVRKIILHDRISVSDPSPSQPTTGLLGLAKSCATRVPLFSADRVYAVSDFVAHRLVSKARVPEERVVKIINGIDLDRFQPGARTDDKNVVEVFCSGRATREKGIDILFRALSLIDGSVLEKIRLQYAGDGPDLSSFKVLVSELGLSEHVTFLGKVDSTVEFLQGCDIAVVPSIWGDACPSAVSEALACGVAVIATRVGGVPEQLGSPPAGVLVPPGDPEALAAALEILCRDEPLRKELGIAARARATNALDEKRYHREVVNHILDDLI